MHINAGSLVLFASPANRFSAGHEECTLLNSSVYSTAAELGVKVPA